MDEERFVDQLSELAARVLHEAGAPEETAGELAEEIAKKICETFGGERYWVPRSFEDLSELLATDHRPVSVVAQEHGVAKTTVYRARRRQLSPGINRR